MSSTVSGAKLASGTRDLREAWEQAKEKWRDSKSEEFERTYIDPLFDTVSAMEQQRQHHAAPAIEELGRTIAKIRRDCE